MSRVGIVGANIAGLGAARGLREAGYKGQILIFDRDRESLADRPALSKAVLIDGCEPPLIAQASELNALSVKVVHQHVQSIDATARTIIAEDGKTYACDSIVLCTGAEPVVPEFISDLGSDVALSLRTAADARRLQSALSPGRRIVVLGGGLIGMEVAAAARMHEVDVAVVEAEHVPMKRAFGEDCGAHMAGIHFERGVQLLSGSRVTGVVHAPEGVRVELKSGAHVEADMLVVALGVHPATQLAVAAGLAVNDGILVDGFGQTSCEGIYAAGDVTRYPANGELVRSENLLHGHRQGVCAGRTVGGRPTSYDEIQSYWSEQFGHNIQACGSVGSGSSIRPTSPGPFKTYWHDGHCLSGAVMIDGGAEMAAARRLIERRVPMDPEDLMRASSLKNLLRASAN